MSDEWGIFLIPNFSPERDLHSHMERKTSPFLYIKAYLIGVNRSKITNVIQTSLVLDQGTRDRYFLWQPLILCCRQTLAAERNSTAAVQPAPVCTSNMALS